MEDKGFKFELNDTATIEVSDESGVVIGRSDYTDREPLYLIRYANADGVATQKWGTQSALVSGE